MQDYFAELDAAREHLETLGFNQIVAKGIEADDLIGYIAHTLRALNHNVIVVSDDKDFYQIVRKGIKIYRPIKEEFKTFDDVVDEFGMHPRELPRIKAITGEDTDLIPGICELDKENLKLIKCGLGEKTAMKMVMGKKSLSEAIETWQDPPRTKRPWKEKLVTNKNRIFMSYKLARIRVKLKHYLDWEKELLKDIDKRALEDKRPKLKTVIRLKSFLEFKTVNIVNVLKNLGINVKGGSIK
jgi:DNA polymerase-1